VEEVIEFDATLVSSCSSQNQSVMARGSRKRKAEEVRIALAEETLEKVVEEIEKAEAEEEDEIESLKKVEAQIAKLEERASIPICGSVPFVSAVEEDDAPKKKTKTAKAKSKSKKEKALEDFMLIQLPALRKEVKLKKKDQSSFNVRDFPQYFKVGGDFIPTYCLSLFNFLGKNEIVCTQYGVFEKNKHLVKTIEGFNHANLIIGSVGPDVLSPDEAEHMMKRFGREWFKIPAKDAPRVSTAYRFGDNHQFKVVLTGIYEDSFYDDNGDEIFTANPVLRYEPFRAPSTSVALTTAIDSLKPVKKRRKTSASPPSSSSSSVPVTTPAEEMEFVASLLEENAEDIL